MIIQRHTYYRLALMIFIISMFAIANKRDLMTKTMVKDLNFQKQIIANEQLFLDFEVTTDKPLQLIAQNSYGTVIIAPDPQKNIVSRRFIIPAFMAIKKGVLQYSLLEENKEIWQGSITILPQPKLATSIESYLGPTSINAGGKDYSMMVAIPTDYYDNLLTDSTAVEIKHQFLNFEKIETKRITDGISWSRIFSYEKSGRILVTAGMNQISSKEFTIDVFPGQAEDFIIKANQIHAYADGNQITTLYTSVIKDRYKNMVSDGRMVNFSITTNKKERLSTTGITINGIAKAHIVHPDHPSQWSVKAFIPQMAESQTLHLDFKAAVNDFQLQFSSNNRTIEILPIRSFMGQLIPDGARVCLTIHTENKKITKIIKYSSKGQVIFVLNEDFYPDGVYDLQIETMGIQKKQDRIQLK